MTGHIDSETIAAFREDLLPADEAAGIAAHLAACPQCAEVDAQLAAVTAILASTPAPPMPASLAARLDAALAAEAARAAQAAPPAAAAASPAAASPHVASPGAASLAAAAPPPGTAPPAGAASPAGPAAPAATAPAAGSPVPGGRRARRAGRAGTAPGHAGPGGPGGTGPGHAAAGHRPGRSRAPGRRSLRLAAAAAVVVLLAGGGYAISRSLSTGSSPVSAGSPAASPSGPAGVPGSAAAPAAAPRVSVTAGLPLVASGTDYQAGHLPAQVRALLRRYPAFERSAKAAPPVVSTAAFPHLAACVSALAGGQRPRLVDIARYGTRPAAVIVAPAAGTSAMRVWVVGTGCSARGGDVIARLSVPAPG